MFSLFPISLIVGRLRDEIVQRRLVEGELRDVLETAPDAMVNVSRDGQIVFINRQASKSFGYTVDELVGRPVEVLLPERLRKSGAGLFTATGVYFSNSCAVKAPSEVSKTAYKPGFRAADCAHAAVAASQNRTKFFMPLRSV